MKVVVIGAGVIGVTTALTLLREGHEVTLVDREGVAAGASQGNAGAFAFSGVIPVATPGVMVKAPQWLFDPLGPLSVPPKYAFKLMPWLLRFLRASLPDQLEPTVAAHGGLMAHSSQALEALVQRYGLEGHLHREGQVDIYDTEASYRASLPHWDLAARHGVQYERLEGREAIEARQKGLAPQFCFGVSTPQWLNVYDPKVWVEALADLFVKAGGQTKICEVRGITIAGENIHVETADGVLSADRVVLAAGAFSHKLAYTLGDHIPLETERGYNTTLPSGAFELQTFLTFADHGFVVGRSGEGIRVGGAVELGGLALPPNFKRADALLAKAKRFLPDLKTSDGRKWMGFRPSTPDCRPVISASPKTPNVIYAFGHGHLGLTQSVGTAELVADLVAGRRPAIDLAPFRADRFTSILRGTHAS